MNESMKRTLLIVLVLLFGTSLGQGAYAAMQVNQESALMLQAAAAFTKRDFRGAESIYTRVLSVNPKSVEATVQRALTRRELKNLQGMQSDARRAVELIDAEFPQNPNSDDLYYNRSVANRLLGDFDAAERDVRQSYRLGHRGLMDNDLNTIALERKMNSFR